MRRITSLMTRRRAAALGVAAALAVTMTAAVQASSPVASVTGSYTYVVFEGGS